MKICIYTQILMVRFAGLNTTTVLFLVCVDKIFYKCFFLILRNCRESCFYFYFLHTWFEFYLYILTSFASCSLLKSKFIDFKINFKNKRHRKKCENLKNDFFIIDFNLGAIWVILAIFRLYVGSAPIYLKTYPQHM